jgi:tryptophan synthase alpha chain
LPTRTEPEPLSKRLRTADGDLKLAPYLMAGHPNLARSAEAGRRLATSGVAALELGIPFSDPLADGPVIQRAGQVALEHGMSMARALDLAADIAEEGGAPIVLMTYVNPVLAYDPRRFAADAAQAGVAGVIFPDLPAEEAEPVAGWIRSVGLDVIFLVAPTTSDERVRSICAASTGFVYCVTLTGITGMRHELPPALDSLLTRVRDRTVLPIAAGFGISRPEHLLALRGLADAAVVGSAVVAELDAGRDPAVLVRELLRVCR